MSRTDLDPATIARSLRRIAGDGSMEWVTEPIQASVLLDVADMLDENAKLREEFDKMDVWHSKELSAAMAENAKLRELLRDAWGDGHPDRSCDGCDIRDECHDDAERMRKDGVLRFSRCLFELRIEDRMRELGIETGDGVS